MSEKATPSHIEGKTIAKVDIRERMMEITFTDGSELLAAAIEYGFGRAGLESAYYPPTTPQGEESE